MWPSSPALLAVSPGTAAAAYPDNVAQPVNFGDAVSYGPAGGLTLNAPDVAMAATHDGGGYWIAAADGGVFNYGDAGFYGSAGSLNLNKPIVGMAATPDGGGYWLVASDGGIFNYGDAGFYGSRGGQPLNAPIVGMASSPTGRGYWLVASDGGIFTYGDASFWGSAGSLTLNKPIVGMAATPDGGGYWLVASDGGIFNYGDAPFLGSMGRNPLNSPVVGMAASGGGYVMAAADGGVFNFGTGFQGSMGGQSLANPVVGIAATPDGGGYWLLPAPPPPAPPTVGPGDTGAAVSQLQTQLLSLGYWVDTTSGSFDDSTEQAVWALQKAANLPRDGVVGPATWAALEAGVVPQPQPESGYEIQIDLADDLLMVVNNNKLRVDAQHVDRRRLRVHRGRRDLHRRYPDRGVPDVPGGGRTGDRLARHVVDAEVLLRGLCDPRRPRGPALPGLPRLRPDQQRGDRVGLGGEHRSHRDHGLGVLRERRPEPVSWSTSPAGAAGSHRRRTCRNR